MRLSVQYDGHDITDYLTVTPGFEKEIGTKREVTLGKVGYSRGKDFLHATSDEGVITMPFIIIDNINERCRKLASILAVNEPKKLIFGDEPDKYYMAIAEGDIKTEVTKITGKGTIKWKIPDGLAHSEVIKTFKASENSKGIMEVEINNEGTAEVPVNYRIKHGDHDNGYIGIVSEYGAMQFGKVDEVDGTTYEQSEKLLEDNFNVNVTASNMKGWVLNKGYQPTSYSVGQSGTIKFGVTTQDYIDPKQRNYVAPDSYGSKGSKLFYGPSITKELPADSNGEVGAKNWSTIFRGYQITGLVNQCGLAQYTITDKSGNNIATMMFLKNNAVNNALIVRFYIRNILKKEFVVDNGWNNPATGWNTGQSSIKKMGEKIEFYTNNTTYTYDDNEIKDMIAKYFTIQTGRVNDRNPWSINMFQFVHFWKHKVEKWKDIPNRYSAKDELVIKGEETKPYINGLLTLEDEMKGTKYFLVPPGKTKIEIHHSSFGVLDAVEAEIREAWC